MNYGNRSVAYVHQLAGDDNDATIEQRAEDSDALIQQSGDRNTASINQREDSPPTENFSAQIWQSGDDGQSSIDQDGDNSWRSEEHTSELQSLMRKSYAVFCLKKKKHKVTVKTSTRR